ncbi:hypothetical protein [Streptomyces siamensis]
MAQQGIIAAERMDGSAALRAVDGFKLVYAEAFAEPPYDETEDDVAAFRRFPVQVRNRTFRAALARAEDGGPIGMAYGHRLGRTGPAAVRRADHRSASPTCTCPRSEGVHDVSPGGGACSASP